MEKLSVKNISKFVICTLLGLFLVVIPLNFGNGVDTFTFYYLKKFVTFAGHPLVVVITCCIVLSAVLALIDKISHPAFIQNRPIMKSLFSCSDFDIVNRILGAIISVMVCFDFGPEFVTSIDTGGTMLPLSTQLSIIIPPMILFQTFILEFGFMEFLGTLIGFVVKPLFKISEMAAVSIISAWVGPGNAAIMGTKQLFDDGYYTAKEAAVIGTTFATSSIGWVALVANVLGVMDKFGWMFATITVVGIIVALIGVRIPPISKYQDIYANGTEKQAVKEEEKVQGGRVYRSLLLAGNRAETAGIKNFQSKGKNMLTYIFALQPVIVCWGTVALMIFMYTPVLTWISYPIGWFMNITGVPEAYAAAPAILSGFADNYLPIILGQAFESLEVKFIIGTMSILQLIYMSEIGSLLSSTKLIPKFRDIIIIFLERTVIALPFVIAVTKLIF